MNALRLKFLKVMAVFTVMVFGLGLVGDSLAQIRRGGWNNNNGGYRPQPPRQMQPSITPKFNAAARPSMPTPRSPPGSPGGGTGGGGRLPQGPIARQMPAKVATTPVAQVKSFDGRMTTTGKPMVSNSAGKTFGIPPKGVMSTKVITRFGQRWAALIKVSGNKAKIIKARLISVAKGANKTSALTAKFNEAAKPAATAADKKTGSGGASKFEVSKSGAKKTVDDLIGESKKGRETKGRADQYIHEGGREQRDKDFDSLGATDVEDRGNGTKTGTLPDGRPVNVHDSKTDGVPTIQIGNGSREIKIRYP